MFLECIKCSTIKQGKKKKFPGLFIHLLFSVKILLNLNAAKVNNERQHPPVCQSTVPKQKSMSVFHAPTFTKFNPEKNRSLNGQKQVTWKEQNCLRAQHLSQECDGAYMIRLWVPSCLLAQVNVTYRWPIKMSCLLTVPAQLRICECNHRVLGRKKGNWFSLRTWEVLDWARWQWWEQPMFSSPSSPFPQTCDEQISSATGGFFPKCNLFRFLKIMCMWIKRRKESNAQSYRAAY